MAELPLYLLSGHLRQELLGPGLLEFHARYRAWQQLVPEHGLVRSATTRCLRRWQPGLDLCQLALGGETDPLTTLTAVTVGPTVAAGPACPVRDTLGPPPELEHLRGFSLLVTCRHPVLDLQLDLVFGVTASQHAGYLRPSLRVVRLQLPDRRAPRELPLPLATRLLKQALLTCPG